MKITRGQLRRLVKETITEVMEETHWHNIIAGETAPPHRTSAVEPAPPGATRPENLSRFFPQGSLPPEYRLDPGSEVGYSKFQSEMNTFLDASGYEVGMWYYWHDEDILVALGGEKDAREMGSTLYIAADRWKTPWGSGPGQSGPHMNPSVVELEDGNWAVKLNAQMTQDPQYHTK